MKPIIFPVLMLLASFAACGQSSNLDRFYEKYQQGGQLNMSFSGGGDKDDWFQKVKRFHYLSIDADRSQEWADLSRSLNKDDFEEWFSARKGKSKVQLLSKEGRNDQTDIVCLLVGEEGKGMFFHLSGRFTAADKDRIRMTFTDKASNGDKE